MAVHIPGLISIVVFYIFILVIGIYASRKTAKTKDAEEMFVANRNLSLTVALFTLTATMVGGGFINGAAESMAYHGLLWTQAPVGYSLAMGLCGIFYARKMRRMEYVTMFDPFQIKYGNKVGALLFVPQLLGDVFWGASILAALGSTLAIILELNRIASIIVSAVVAMTYTFFGGLYAVAYTDVAQLLFIAVGLTVAFPFAMYNDAVDFSTVRDDWLGEVTNYQRAIFAETLLLVFLGGIPWQTYWQRVLACKSPRHSFIASLFAAVMSLILAIPAVMIGYTGKAADWNHTAYTGPIPIPEENRSYILPMVLQYLCPVPIAILGMGAIAGAVMSSSDSCILSSATIFTQNIYRSIFRTKASKAELVWILRIAIAVVGGLQTVIAITSTSVYGLFVLCGDLMYVVMFPQFTLVLYYEKANSYGCLSGYLLSLILRIGGGEPLLNVPPFIYYPYWNEEHGQLFPFRTFAMVCGAVTLVVTSLISRYLFMSGKLKKEWDILKVFGDETNHKVGPLAREDYQEYDTVPDTKL